MVMIKFWWKNPPSVVTIRPRLATAASRESDCQVWNVYYDDFDQFFLSSPSKYQFSATGGVLWHNLIWRFFFLLFLGDLKNEGSVLEWLLSSDNRELDDAIEAVNEKMLSKLLQTTPFMAVFFCKFSFWLYTKKKKIQYFAHLIQQLILKIVFDQLGKVIHCDPLMLQQKEARR
jgi:hypothetical protein